MKLIFIILITSNILLSDTFKLNKNEIKYIKTLHNKKQILKRFSNFSKFFKEVKKYEELKQLYRTNNFVNRLIAKHDGNTDTWLNPKEFLIKGRGDCEDYAITKYFALEKLGFDINKLYLTVVQVKGFPNTYHLVVMFMNKNNIPMILDNLSWKVLPLNKRKTLKFIFAFDENHSYIFKKNKLVIENKIRRGEVKLFKSMLNKIRE